MKRSPSSSSSPSPSKRRALRWGALLLAIVFVLGSAAEADARRRRRRRRKRRRSSGQPVLLLSVSGPQARRAYRGLYRGLRFRQRRRLVRRRRFFRVVKKLGVDPTSKGGLTAACAKAGCTFVVRGKVARARRRRYTLTVSAIHAPSGNVAFEQVFKARSRRRLTRAGYRAARALDRATIAYKLPPPPPPPPPKPPAPSPVVSKTPQPTTVAKKPDDDDDGAGDGASGRKDVARADAMIIASAGVGISSRNLLLVGPGETDQRKHGGGAFAELTLAAQIYPLVPLTKSFARHIGLWISFSHHLGINTQPAANVAASDDPGGNARQLVGGAVVRVPLGPVRVRGAIGLGVRDFSLDSNTVVPPLSYRFVDISLMGSVILGSPLAVLHFGFSARPLVGAGQDTVNALGELDGGFAYTVGGGFSGRLPFGLMYFARFEYQSYDVDYAGLGGTARPPVAGTFERADPSNAVDRYVRAWAGVGYVY